MSPDTFKARLQMLLALFDVLGHDGIPADRHMAEKAGEDRQGLVSEQWSIQLTIARVVLCQFRQSAIQVVVSDSSQGP